MSRPLGVIENIDSVKHLPIGTFWGVKLAVTPLTWAGPIIFFAMGMVLSLLQRELSLQEHAYNALLFTLAVELTTVFHALGHILSGKLVRAPMDELLMSTTRDVNLYYGDQSRYPLYIHIVRSLGGPALNIILAGLFTALAPATSGAYTLLKKPPCA